jgi:pantetheine-phosphate adenylyltransferase
VTADIKNVRIESFDGLLADYVNNNGIDLVLRGLRAGTDFEYEIAIAQLNKNLFTTDAETIFLMTDPKNSFISSSIVKEVMSYAGDISGLVPKQVLKYISEVKK